MSNKVATLILTMAFTMFFFSACKKNNNIPTPVTIKYEIISTTAVKDTTAIGSIKFTDANGADQTTTDFLPGYNSWSKTITLTTTTRPLTVKLSTPATFYVESQGSFTGKIYVNDVLFVHSTTNTISGNNYFSLILPEITTVVN
jgi:hypothetical protein